MSGTNGLPTLTVRLEEWQNAEPRKCGSCNHFRRSGAVGGDWCGIRLPEWVMVRNLPDEENQRSVSDGSTCDLWAPKSIHGQVVAFEKIMKWKANGIA